MKCFLLFVCFGLPSLFGQIVSDQFPAAYFPSSCHLLVSLSPNGDSVQLEDGSVWKIDDPNAFKLLYWRPSDPLMITQNTSWFSSYKYRMVNRSNGSSIDANLVKGPNPGNCCNRYITELDLDRGILTLSDRTYWEVSSGDQSLLSEWKCKDSVIIGYNSSGWDSSYESLLVNVSTQCCIRCRKF
jgi:hypothetical protein